MSRRHSRVRDATRSYELSNLHDQVSGITHDIDELQSRERSLNSQCRSTRKRLNVARAKLSKTKKRREAIWSCYDAMVPAVNNGFHLYISDYSSEMLELYNHTHDEFDWWAERYRQANAIYQAAEQSVTDLSSNNHQLVTDRDACRRQLRRLHKQRDDIRNSQVELISGFSGEIRDILANAGCVIAKERIKTIRDYGVKRVRRDYFFYYRGESMGQHGHVVVLPSGQVVYWREPSTDPTKRGWVLINER